MCSVTTACTRSPPRGAIEQRRAKRFGGGVVLPLAAAAAAQTRGRFRRHTHPDPRSDARRPEHRAQLCPDARGLWTS